MKCVHAAQAVYSEAGELICFLVTAFHEQFDYGEEGQFQASSKPDLLLPKG